MIENELPNEAVESVDVCLDALTRIQYLIDDILTFTRKNFNGQKICSINGITKSAYDIMHTNAERKNINLILDLDPSLPGVYFDKSKLLQVFINLITNAIESCDSSGEILIKTSLEDKEYLIWEIKDNGMGISEENKRNIFQDFYTSKEKGTGLGLALTKQIVEKHGGHIWFYSSPGKGSEFHFTVPSSVNTILIVKNDKEKRRKFCEYLNARFPAYKILEAENGYEALGMIINHMPALILTDKEMPLLDGVQLIRTLREADRPIKIPVIAMLNANSEIVNNEYEKFEIKTIADDPAELDNINEELSAILN